MVLASRQGGSVKLACLSCPTDAKLVIMRVDEGKTSSGQKFAQNHLACPACPKGYHLKYPSEVRGGNSDGGSYAFREAGCWRCPEGKSMKGKVRQSRRNGGSLMKSRTIYCE